MSSLEIHDGFQPYYAGREPFSSLVEVVAVVVRS